MTATGYVADSAAPQSRRSPGAVEFVHRGVYPWTAARSGVAAESGDGRETTITMAKPAFGSAVELCNSTWEGQSSRGPGLPTRVEDDASAIAGEREVDAATAALQAPGRPADPARRASR
ncbi:hypothetical protein [Nonomuraea sp. NPDC048916]|uniref:hypothetical protein n=1 Tax=Nonomuraea sp. NPDC048916 TaxID=3154232 RepID=UPI0033FA0104